MDAVTHYTLTFVLYSFIGYLCEVAYCSIGQRHLVNRGFLYGPWLPIYGFGGLIVDIFLVPISSYPLLVFIAAIILTSAVEYVGSWALEKIFSIKLWDYSEHKFNINGRVCLLNSSLFGLMSMILVYGAYPWIQKAFAMIPVLIAERLGDLLRILFAVDLTLSVIKMSAFKKALGEVREKAKSVEAKVQELKSLGKSELSEEFRIKLTLELEELRDKTRNSYTRIISAFPSATSKHEEVKQQLQNIQTWAKERREASLEMKAKIKETKAEYKEKVKTINDNAKGKKND
ncbi:MAG: hypothetical protein MSS69_06565 [Spirochaetales bacterium]|nr:hypothetical protein [Spirochaetales bacterium]